MIQILKKLIKAMRSNTISRDMRKIFYNECVKKIEDEKIEQKGKFKRLTSKDRISIEILHTAGFNNAIIGMFIGKNRSNIKREIDKNMIEIWDINSTKSPYREKGQINIKYYSSGKAQKNANENRLRSRKKCKIDKYPILRDAIVSLLKDKNMAYSLDIIANFSKEGKIKNAETTISAKAIYKAVHDNKYKLIINIFSFKSSCSFARVFNYIILKLNFKNKAKFYIKFSYTIFSTFNIKRMHIYTHSYKLDY